MPASGHRADGHGHVGFVWWYFSSQGTWRWDNFSDILGEWIWDKNWAVHTDEDSLMDVFSWSNMRWNGLPCYPTFWQTQMDSYQWQTTATFTLSWLAYVDVLSQVCFERLGFCFFLVLTKHVPLPLVVWCSATGVETFKKKDRFRLTSDLGNYPQIVVFQVCELLQLFCFFLSQWSTVTWLTHSLS